MKYCTHCGHELNDAAVVCVHCGCLAEKKNVDFNSFQAMVQKLSERVKVNGFIWLAIAIVQIVMGIAWDWILIIVGVLNLVSAIQDINYSKAVLESPEGIVEKFQPLVGPIVTLVYNLIFGGVIGVAGLIYYLLCVRNFVLENRFVFENQQ